VLYFAYGSNLNHYQMKNIRCFGSRYLKAFFLKDYKLIFCHPNKLNKFGYANIIKKRGSQVAGAIWEITKEHEKILDEAKDWLAAKRNVVLATVIQTWGSSPRPIGSRMIINDKGDFSGSVSGGCVETAVVRECLGLIKEKKPFKKIEFKVSNESAWEVGLACGGEIAIFLEQIN